METKIIQYSISLLGYCNPRKFNTHSRKRYIGSGQIWNDGTVIITNCSFTNNTATNGGVIDSIGNVTMTNSSFINNTASNLGGVIDNNPNNLTITDCTFANNSATMAEVLFMF